jgi:prepilin-type N-terminal cleavage/methylation domain-containing protein
LLKACLRNKRRQYYSNPIPDLSNTFRTQDAGLGVAAREALITVKVKVKRRHHCQAGFTLIEVMMVTLIAGALLSVAFFNLNRAVAHWELVTTARTMVSDIREARDEALNKGKAEVWFCGKTGDGHYKLYDCDGKELKKVDLPQRVVFVKLTFSTENGDYYILRFPSSGNPGPAFAGSAYLKSKTGAEYRRVAVLGSTGRVRITKDPP